MSKISIACGILMSSQLFCFTAINAASAPNADDLSPVNSKYREHHCPPPKPGPCHDDRQYYVGPTGPAGPTGAAGQRGLQGPQGKRGERGHKGERGCEGERGCQGEQGHKGERGCQGEQGVRGCKGDPGPQGPAGPQGLAGENGENGENGLNGIRGATGATGAVGATGLVGPTGATAAILVGNVAFQATQQGDGIQVVLPGNKVAFNTLNHNEGSQVIITPAIPAATDFTLPPSSLGLYLVSYGISIGDLSPSPSSFALQLLDPPAIPVPTPVLGSSLGLTVPDVFSMVTCFVVTTGPTPTLSVIYDPGQVGPAFISMTGGDTSALISITKLK